MKTAGASILDACQSTKLFSCWFKDAQTWRAWFAFLAAMFGLPMDAEAREIFKACTSRSQSRSNGHAEAWLICGRRSGKSFILALIAVFLACFRDWSPYLAPGERGTVFVVATDRRQARVIYRYVRALLLNVPAIASLMVG